MKKIWIQKALSLKSLAAQHRLQTAWCMVGLNNPDSQKHTDTEATTCTCACTWHAFQVTQDRPGCVHMQNSVQDMHKIPAHNAFIDHWCSSVHTGPRTVHGVFTQAHQWACIWLPMHTQSAECCIYSHTERAHTCAHWLKPMNIRVLEGEGKSYVSQDYVPGRYQETLAGGFHIAILSLIKTFFCHFFLSWLPNTVGQRY